jgi:hypothetical protein
LPEPVEAAPDGDGRLDDIPQQTDFFGRVLERSKVCIEGIDVPATLDAVQAAVYELDEWHQVFATEDSLACMRRAVVVGCEDFLLPDAVSHVLSARREVAELDTFSGDCHVAEGAGQVALELQLVPMPSDPRIDLWGAVTGADAHLSGTRFVVSEDEAQQLLDTVLPLLQERLRDLPGVCVEAAVACSEGTSFDVGAPDEQHVLRVSWRVDANKADTEVMNHVVVCAADLIRYASHHSSSDPCLSFAISFAGSV